MSELRGLVTKIEKKIEELDREKSRLQDDLKVVNKAEKIRQRLDGKDSDEGEKHHDQKSNEEDKDQEFDHLREKVHEPEKEHPHASW